MRLPDIELDDRRFDDLVAEARQRVAQACPEWNAHNVSDPGVALIDVFAWMTDQLLYRVNRIPDKLHVRLLELLGIQLAPPSAATAELRFTLASPPADPVLIPGGTEVETPARRSGDTVVFQVGDDFTIPAAQAAQLVACAIGRQGELTPVEVEGGRARPRGDDRLAFGEPPVAGNAIYLGFGQPLGRLLIDLTVDCAPARRVGGDPGEAPLRWHVSRADGSWTSADVLEDTTAGFEHGSGTIRLQLPDETAAAAVGERRAHWIRCEIAEPISRCTSMPPRSRRSPPLRWARACPPPTPPPMPARRSGRARALPDRRSGCRMRPSFRPCRARLSRFATR